MSIPEALVTQIKSLQETDPVRGELYSSLLDSNIETDYVRVFFMACEKGDQDIVKWICSLRVIDIHMRDDYGFRRACYRGHETIAKWLYSLGGVDIHARNDDALVKSHKNGHISITKWLYSLDRAKGIEIRV